MLVIIVSLGFGIVKPRLGPTLHRVVGIGGLYFALASTEAYLRVMKPKNDVSTGTLLAGIPLAVIDRYIDFIYYLSYKKNSSYIVIDLKSPTMNHILILFQLHMLVGV